MLSPTFFGFYIILNKLPILRLGISLSKCVMDGPLPLSQSVYSDASYICRSIGFNYPSWLGSFPPCSAGFLFFCIGREAGLPPMLYQLTSINFVILILYLLEPFVPLKFQVLTKF